MATQHRSDILFTFFVAILLAAAWHVRSVLLLIYIAGLFAVVVGPGIKFVQRMHVGRWRPGRGVATLSLLAAGFGVLTLFFVFAIPPIFRDIQAFSTDLPGKVSRVVERVQHLPFAQGVDPSSLQGYVANALGGVLGVFKGVAGGVAGFFSWLVLTAYFIIGGERAFHWTLSLFPQELRPKLEYTAVVAERRVSRWLLGQLTLMLILGTSSMIVFWVLGVKYFYALGVFAGITNIVPIVGPVISAVLAATVAAFDSWTKAAVVVIFYLIYQQVENAYLTPRIMKSTVDLPALAVVIALAIGGTLAGILGALVAVPTAALIAVILDEYVVKSDTAATAPHGR
ncbi:MAG TPA: AI-2E family transporter [Clostridia bacterium]|nr:AI-2E family transporter [Clostridia bacterium]